MAACVRQRSQTKLRDWEYARQKSPLASEIMRTARWENYWDYIAMNNRVVPDLDGDEIVSYFREEQIVKKGDTILDIGCGQGRYSLPLATIAGQVTGIDQSRSMIDNIRHCAAAAGISNVTTIHGQWENHVPDDRYDLVLSAFCPAINAPESLLRMERLSRRSCCYVAGDESQFGLLGEMWKVVFGQAYFTEVHSIRYPFNFLRSLGREPRLRCFRSETAGYTRPDEVIREFIAYFSCLTEMSPAIEGRIRRYVKSRSKKGKFGTASSSIRWALRWEVPVE